MSVAFASLETHGNADSLWIAVRGTVYDVTTFAMDHPGGADVLLECAGADGTETFEAAGHGEEHLQRLAQNVVGPLERTEALDAPVAEGGVPARPPRRPAKGVGVAGWRAPSLPAVPMLLAATAGLAAWKGGSMALAAEEVGVRVVAPLLGLGLVGWWMWGRAREQLDVFPPDVFAYPPVIPRRTST